MGGLKVPNKAIQTKDLECLKIRSQFTEYSVIWLWPKKWRGKIWRHQSFKFFQITWGNLVSSTHPKVAKKQVGHAIISNRSIEYWIYWNIKRVYSLRSTCSMLSLFTQSTNSGFVHFLLNNQSSPTLTDFDLLIIKKQVNCKVYSKGRPLQESGIMFLSKALCLKMPIRRAVAFKPFE